MILIWRIELASILNLLRSFHTSYLFEELSWEHIRMFNCVLCSFIGSCKTSALKHFARHSIRSWNVLFSLSVTSVGLFPLTRFSFWNFVTRPLTILQFIKVSFSMMDTVTSKLNRQMDWIFLCVCHWQNKRSVSKAVCASFIK